MSRDSTHRPGFPRRSLAVPAALLALAAGAAGHPAAAMSAAPAPYHQPPWLVAPGRPVTLAYALLDPSVTGAVYVRNELRRTFTRLTLTPGPYCPGDPVDAATMRREKVCGTALLAHVPASLVAGSRLFYYAVLREGATGRTTTVPARGAAAPQRVWVVRDQVAVPLGPHRFGHLRAPDALVARAGRGQVGITCCADPPGGDGPSSFDIAADGSAWMLDRLNHRLLAWRPGRPALPARAVPLPQSLSLTDMALGRDGTIFARGDDTAALGRGSKSHVYALTPAGRVRWQAAATTGIPTAPLQVGADGVLYAAQACGGSCAPFGGETSWTPLTTAGGLPLPAAARRSAATPFERDAGGLRLVSELSLTVARFALVDGADRIVRAWRVTSASRLGPLGGAPALVHGDLVVPLEVSRGARAERVILRLGPSGVRRSFSVAAHPVVGETTFAALRIAPDGRLYQLKTSLSAGASIVSYSL
jgi:hypothetical protein